MVACASTTLKCMRMCVNVEEELCAYCFYRFYRNCVDEMLKDARTALRRLSTNLHNEPLLEDIERCMSMSQINTCKDCSHQYLNDCINDLLKEIIVEFVEKGIE